MADTDEKKTGEGVENAADQENANTENGKSQEDNGKGGEENGKKIDWSKLPEELRFLERELTDARKEAAQRRTQSKEYLDKITELEGKIPTEDVQNELKTWRTKAEQNEIELTKLRVASEVGLDPELTDFVTGTTEDEIREKAKKLAERTKRTPAPTKTPPTGGSTPGADDKPTDGKSTLERLKAQNRY